MKSMWLIIRWLKTLTKVVLSDHKKLEALMAQELDLENDLQAVSDGVAALAQEIADLKAANSSVPVTQAQLDALDAKAQAIVAAINAGK